ncbi:hypothetical protein F4703DRAFT_1848555, partial [Phycomyces blakesleeanus]
MDHTDFQVFNFFFCLLGCIVSCGVCSPRLGISKLFLYVKYCEHMWVYLFLVDQFWPNTTSQITKNTHTHTIYIL